MIFCATSPASPGLASSERIAANSSPPSRPTVSLARTQLRSRPAASLSSLSPAPCPSVSLTSLNRSRSMKSTAIGQSLRLASAMACVRRSWNRLRLGKSVSASNCARYETFSSMARRARMSREILPADGQHVLGAHAEQLFPGVAQQFARGLVDVHEAHRRAVDQDDHVS